MTAEFNQDPCDIPHGEHYVYLYIDACARVRYVGYGGKPKRASSYQAGGSHNDKLNSFLSKGPYRIEIAGPYGSESCGRAVETALISALKPKFNIDPGQSRLRFRPLGVPIEFAERLTDPELHLSDFLAAQGSVPTPVLFVIITDIDFEGRVGYNPARPPTDEQIRQRVDRWWQLKRFMPKWKSKPEVSPGLLIGVFGSPGRQIVIAALRIDRSNWDNAEIFRGGKIRIPLVDPLDLDAFALRGRRIVKNAGLRFGGISAQFFRLLGVDGAIVGGCQPPK